MQEGSKRKRSISLKAQYDLADFLDWTYHSNRTVFEVLVARSDKKIIHRELLRRYYHVGFRQKLLAACGLSIDHHESQDEIDTAFTDIASYCHTLLDDEVRNWLAGRGVTPEQTAKHQIGCNKEYNPLRVAADSRSKHWSSFFYPPLIEIDEVKTLFGKDRMTVVTVPFFDCEGKVINLSCRITDDDYGEVFKYFFSHGRTALFNANNIDLRKPFYVFEGVFDTLTAERFDIPSVALGCSVVSEEQRKLLAACPHAVLCLDGDVAGRTGMAKEEMPKLFLPNGFDVDEILRADPSYADTFRLNLAEYRYELG